MGYNIPSPTRAERLLHFVLGVLTLFLQFRHSLLPAGGGFDHQTRNQAACSQLIIHGVPNRSTTMPKRADQKVFCSGICTLPSSANALNMRSASSGSLIRHTTQFHCTDLVIASVLSQMFIDGGGAYIEVNVCAILENHPRTGHKVTTLSS